MEACSGTDTITACRDGKLACKDFFFQRQQWSFDADMNSRSIVVSQLYKPTEFRFDTDPISRFKSAHIESEAELARSKTNGVQRFISFARRRACAEGKANDGSNIYACS